MNLNQIMLKTNIHILTEKVMNYKYFFISNGRLQRQLEQDNIEKNILEKQ